MVPPPMPAPPGVRQRSFWVTGSHAISAPRCPSIGFGPMEGSLIGAFVSAGGGVAGAPAPPRPNPNTIPMLFWPGLYWKFLSSVYVNEPPVDAGRYTSPVAGLKDMGAQLWAPPGPGEIETLSSS